MRGTFRGTFASAIAWAILTWVASAAQAQAAITRFDIPPQPLADSLRAIGSLTHVNVLFDPPLVADHQAPALEGEFTTKQAFTLLLAGTGIKPEFLNDRTVVLAMAPSASPAASEKRSPAVTPSTSAPERSYHESSESPRSFWTRFRLAQAETSSRRPTGSDSESSERKTARLDEVVVTAQKREERLIDTPVSVSVLSGDDLSKLGAIQFRDFAYTVPGLSFMTEGAGFGKISLRGVVGSAGGPTVGIYVDEVPYGSSTGFAFAQLLALDVGLFDIERIETLRGPQGTLYGASTMGGLLKYVTRQPEQSFGVDLSTGISGTEHGGFSYSGSATLNAPLTGDNKAALRATGFYSGDGGYIDNLGRGERDVNSSDIYGGRADLLLAPSEALDIRITAFGQDISRDGIGTADYVFSNPSVADRIASGDFSGRPREGSREQRRLTEETFEQRFRLVSGTLTLDLEPATLISITSYQTANTDFVIDVSQSVSLCTFLGTTCSALSQPTQAVTDKFTQEMRLTGDESVALQWIIGGFYTRETSDLNVTLIGRDPAGQPIPVETLNLLTLATPSHYEEYAAFGDLTWRLTEKFDLTGGLRYANNKQTFEQIGSGRFGTSAPLGRSSEDVYTYLGNARYRFSDHATGYLRYATGYRPGGPNYALNDPTTGLPLGGAAFEPDRLKSYEVGFKTEMANRRFGVDVAAYYIDWSNLQITIRRGGFGAVGNAAGGASVRGGEVILSARPVSRLAMAGSYVYQDGQLSETEAALGGRKGERLPEVPRHSAALRVDYALPWLGSLSPAIGATLQYVGDRTAAFDARTTAPLQYSIPDYFTADVRAGITLGSVDVQLYVRNLFDEEGQLSARTFNGPQPAMLQPRTIGIGATASF